MVDTSTTSLGNFKFSLNPLNKIPLFGTRKEEKSGGKAWKGKEERKERRERKERARMKGRKEGWKERN